MSRCLEREIQMSRCAGCDLPLVQGATEWLPLRRTTREVPVWWFPVCGGCWEAFGDDQQNDRCVVLYRRANRRAEGWLTMDAALKAARKDGVA